MSVSDNDALQLLKSHMPGGMERWQNITSSGYIGKLWTALAQSIKLYGYDVLDTLRNELRAASMTERLPDWEEATGLASSRVALIGTAAQRRGQIVSRRRESGASTLPNIKGALAAVCGYEPTILEHSRADVDAHITINVNPYPFGGPGDPINAGVTTYTARYGDVGTVSNAGARVYLRIAHAAATDLNLRLYAPSGATKEWNGITDFHDGEYTILWWPECAGLTIAGTWTFQWTNIGATVGEIEIGLLAVDSIGRAAPFSSVEARGSAIFEWAALVDPALVSSGFDVAAAREIVRRWNPAHCRAYFCLTGIGSVTATAGIWGDPTNSVWDGFVWE